MAAEVGQAQYASTRPHPEPTIETLPNPNEKDPNFGITDPPESQPETAGPTLTGNATAPTSTISISELGPSGTSITFDRSMQPTPMVFGSGSTTVFDPTRASGSNTVLITDSGTVVVSADNGATVVFTPAYSNIDSTPPEPVVQGTIPGNKDPNFGIVDPDKPESQPDPATLLRDAKPAGLRMVWRDNGSEVRRLEMTDGTWPLPVASADGTLPIPMAKKTSMISILQNPGSSGQTIYFNTVASADGQHSGVGAGLATEDGKVIPDDGPTIPSPIPKIPEGPGPWTGGDELPKDPPKGPSAIPGMPGGILPWATGKGTIIKFGSGSNTVFHSGSSGPVVVVGTGATVVLNPKSGMKTKASSGSVSVLKSAGTV